MIAISLSPNTEFDDVLLALKILLMPWMWGSSRKSNDLENKFTKITGLTGHAISINSGRSGLYLILKALGIGKGDEVIVQAFTCVAVPNSSLWLGAKPVYADIDESFNINPSDLEKKITGKTRAIIIQHTFGIPAKSSEIKKIADKHGLIIIEDCAHALGSTYGGKRVGSLSDISFFSFGRDKCVSSVYGGMVLVRDMNLYRKIKTLRDELKMPSNFWVFQQLLHPIIMAFVKTSYNLGFGKITFGKMTLVLFQKLKLLSFPVYDLEKKCGRPQVFPSKMPSALSVLAIKQLSKLDRFVEHRKRLTKIYDKELDRTNLELPLVPQGAALLRYPVLSKNAKEIIQKFKFRGILLGDWYNKVVVPVEENDCTKYPLGACPVAEKYSKQIINLPTYPTLKISECKKIISLLNA